MPNTSFSNIKMSYHEVHEHKDFVPLQSRLILWILVIVHIFRDLLVNE